MPIEKPESCNGCPLAKLSKYITPDKHVPGATVMILAQAPGEHEEQGLRLDGEGYRTYETKVRPQPLIGRTGRFMRQEFWKYTKLDYNTVSLANVIKCRPHNSNDLPNIGSNKAANGISTKMLKEAISYCTQRYLKIPESVQHIMAMGELSLYALTGEELLHYRKHELDSEDEEKKSTITEWRGWALGYDKETQSISGLHDYYYPSSVGTVLNIFPVVHLASLFQNDRYYHATLHDFQRFGRLVRGEWPEPLPEIKINTIPSKIPQTIGFDTEYDTRRNNALIMYSLADVEHNIYVVDVEYSRELTGVPEKLNLITQNGLVDLPHLLPILPQSFKLSQLNMEDCMLAHSTVWTGEPNSLDYMLSKWGRFNRHKHLRLSHDPYMKYIYAGLDAGTTLNDAWYRLTKDFKRDKLSQEEYLLRRKPLLYPISQSQSIGIAVDQTRVSLVKEIFTEKIVAIEAEAQLLTGNPRFNIKSHQQVAEALYKGNYVLQKEKKESQSAQIRKRAEGKGTQREKSSRSKRAKVQEDLMYTRLLEQLKEKYAE